MDLLHDAGEWSRYVHRRLVGLERDQRIVERHGVAGGDEDLDDRYLTEVPDVGYFDRNRVRGAHTLVGIDASLLIP